VRELHPTARQLQWIVDAYVAVLAGHSCKSAARSGLR
jgi:hypothetical protein